MLNRLQRNAWGLSFFWGDDDTTVVVSAVRTRPMLEFLFVAIRTLLDRRGGGLVVRPALPAASLRMSSLRIRHE